MERNGKEQMVQNYSTKMQMQMQNDKDKKTMNKKKKTKQCSVICNKCDLIDWRIIF